MSQPEKPHDLVSFLKQETDKLAAEYERLSSHVLEDPGTVGDQGEENWARLLRGWLPPTLHVATKGRILGNDGTTSGQVDIVVLEGNYPPALRDSKYYLAAGVLAAFEVKRTLRKEHVERAFAQSARVKATSGSIRKASPYGILCAPIVFGVLAHSHDAHSPNASTEGKDNAPQYMSDWLAQANLGVDRTPYDMPDLFCIANLAAWSATKMFKLHDIAGPDGRIRAAEGPDCFYFGPMRGEPWEHRVTPIGAFLTALYGKLAWRDEQMRELWRTFRSISGIRGLDSYGSRNFSDQMPPWLQPNIGKIGLSTESFDEWGAFYW